MSTKSRFNDAGLCEETVWQMRLADYPRGKNRALIDRLFNGAPPWPEKDVDANNVRTNLNDLSAPRYAADARRSLGRALENSETYFKVSVDIGARHRRGYYGSVLTHELAKIMKNSLKYWETLDSQMALKVLHGNGPVFWTDRERWCPTALAIQDVLIPSRTLRSMENLDHFGVYRQFTYEQLYRLTHGEHVDPGWQLDTVEGALKWVKDQKFAYLQSYAQWYAPQNIEDIIKEDIGYLGTDAVATVDVWDFYYHADEGGKEGWRRRMILDTPLSGEVPAGGRMPMPAQNKYDMDHGKWLYKPADNRVYANKLSEILHFQFGDATATAPFRYHSIRSLGWLLYPFAHLQNRLRSKFIDHLFENLNQYFRSSSKEDHERLLKLDLHNFGEIPENVQFVKQEDRWQINQALVEMGFTQNRSLMDEAAAQYREGRETERPTERETATAVMARVNAANALVGSLLATMYKAQKFQYKEIARRFCLKNSIDPEVREFRARVLKAGVPPSVLNIDAWDITPDRVIGSGNKMLEVAMADKLMAVRPLHDPEAQREILEIYDLANTDDPGLAARLAGTMQKEPSPSVQKAQLMVGTLMQGVPVVPQRGENPEEMAAALLGAMQAILQRVTQVQPTPQELVGLRTVGQAAGVYIQMLGQDPQQQDKAKKMGADLQKMLAAVQQIEQMLAKKTQMEAQARQQGNGGMDPKDQAKMQAMGMQAQLKAGLEAKAAASRAGQQQVAFELNQRQAEQKHQLKMRRDMEKAQLKDTLEVAKTAADIRREGRQTMQSLQE